MGAYRFDRYRSKTAEEGARLALPEGADEARVRLHAGAVAMVRDLINTPTNDLGPTGSRRLPARWPTSSAPPCR